MQAGAPDAPRAAGGSLVLRLEFSLHPGIVAKAVQLVTCCGTFGMVGDVQVTAAQTVNVIRYFDWPAVFRAAGVPATNARGT